MRTFIDREAVQLRLSIARQITASYEDDPKVLAVLCGGSTARGQADRWSDLELLVVWQESPSDRQRQRVIEATGGNDPRLWQWDSQIGMCYDEWWYDGPAGAGLLIEVSHSTVPEIGRLVAALGSGNASLDLLTLGDALVNGIPLTVSAELDSWRAALSPYPRELAIAVVGTYGQIDHFWRWQMYLERGNVLELGVHLAGVVTRCLQMTFALSGVWWPGSKWAIDLAGSLGVAPRDFAERLRLISRLDPERAAVELAAVVDELYDLAETHLPEVDVARLQAIFHFNRRPYT
ncbi:MAG TPA: hypothetical protein VKU87_08050 [Thermomicrobiaceae bacterium]|nr:hypothetical protein [Thermomicrobiaceae bacterium]